MIEVPAPRPERHEVLEVSGQPTVPVLVIENDAGRQVLSDENDILQYLDRNYAPREPAARADWGVEDSEALAALVEEGEARARQMLALSRKARGAGDIDLANCLEAAGKHLQLAQRWSRRRLEELREGS